MNVRAENYGSISQEFLELQETRTLLLYFLPVDVLVTSPDLFILGQCLHFDFLLQGVVYLHIFSHQIYWYV